MEIIVVFSIIGLILAIGFICEQLFRKTGIPDVLLLIGVGLAMRYGFNIVEPADLASSAPLFTTFALLFVLFQGSLSIELRTLLSSARSALQLTLGSFFATALVTAGICYVFGFGLMPSLMIGSILGGTSSIVVVPLLQNLGMGGRTKPILVLESAISDVLCILFTVTLVEAMVSGSVVASELTRSLLSSFGLSIFVGVIVGIFWVYLVERFLSLSRAYVVNIGLVLLLYSFVESPFVMASGPIACLTFGLVLRNAKPILSYSFKPSEIKPILTTEAKNFYTEISFFLKAMFFVYLGILLDFTDIASILLAAVIVIIVFFIRPWIVSFFVRDTTIEEKERTFLEILVPKGFAATVLAQYAAARLVEFPQYAGVASKLLNLSLSVVFFSIVLTSLLVFVTERGWFYGFYKRKSSVDAAGELPKKK